MVDQRNRDRRAADQLRVDGIDLERTPWVDDLVAWVDVGQTELLEQADRSTSDGHRSHIDTDERGQRRPQFGGSMVGVTMDPTGRRLDGGRDRRHRWPRGLVGRQLDGVADAVLLLRLRRGFTGSIGGERLDRGSGSTDHWCFIISVMSSSKSRI